MSLTGDILDKPVQKVQLLFHAIYIIASATAKQALLTLVLSHGESKLFIL